MLGDIVPRAKSDKNMTKAKHNSRRKASALGKTGAERSAHVMNPKYLAEMERFRLMDDTFMSKCLENAPECIELILQIILDKKDLKVVKSQTEYPIKNLQGRGVRFDVFARDSKGKEYDIEIQRENDGAEPKRARYNSALMDANALKAATLTFTPPEGSGLDPTTLSKSNPGTGAQSFMFNKVGDWTVTLTFANGTTRTATITIEKTGFVIIVK